MSLEKSPSGAEDYLPQPNPDLPGPVEGNDWGGIVGLMAYPPIQELLPEAPDKEN
jgi:hypothetical protein